MAFPHDGKKMKKGETLNPNGRPKGVPNSRTRLLRLLELTQQKKNPVTGELETFSVIEQMDMKMIAKALAGDIAAYREIIDRLEGKATNNIDVKTGDKPFTGITVEVITRPNATGS